MRIGLYAPRRSSFVLAGPMARAALKQGHEVVFLRDPAGAKLGDDWQDAEILRPFPDAMSVPLAQFGGDWLAGPPPNQNLEAGDLDRLHQDGVKLCSLDPWFDSLARPFADGYDFTHRTIRHGLIPTDGLDDVVPGHHTDLLWFPPKTRVPGAGQRAVRWAVTVILARALRQVASRGRVRLVVKRRPKIRLPRLVERLADVVLEDATLYPHASLTALGTAALSVCHQSGAAMESVAAGVRCLSVQIPHRHLRGYPHWPLMAGRDRSPYAWPGVIDALPLLPALRWLARWTPAVLPRWGERAAYIDTWLGGRVLGTSDWVLDQMERRG